MPNGSCIRYDHPVFHIKYSTIFAGTLTIWFTKQGGFHDFGSNDSKHPPKAGVQQQNSILEKIPPHKKTAVTQPRKWGAAVGGASVNAGNLCKWNKACRKFSRGLHQNNANLSSCEHELLQATKRISETNFTTSKSRTSSTSKSKL